LEDNTATLTLTTNGEKYRPWTKHLSIKWHHLRGQVKKGWLDIHKVNMKDNSADIFTKPLPRPQFCILHDQMMGWTPRLKGTPPCPDFSTPATAAATLAHTT
jgi:hypothetical protein